ncbi:hypothetical protein [Frateuria aurantia]|uniref:hypothetical protein n=1 Tax=Frateuria aurantia TaxID=81475 RepID=UPI0012E9A4C0|nr:hypothetical protein [Frateuria aurantia]
MNHPMYPHERSCHQIIDQQQPSFVIFQNEYKSKTSFKPGNKQSSMKQDIFKILSASLPKRLDERKYLHLRHGSGTKDTSFHAGSGQEATCPPIIKSASLHHHWHDADFCPFPWLDDGHRLPMQKPPAIPF